MTTAGLDFPRGELALIADGELVFSTTLPDGRSDTAAVETMLAETHRGSGDIAIWAAPDDGAPATLAGRDVFPHPRVKCDAAAAYSTSPFAKDGQPATVVVWHEQEPPRLFDVAAGAVLDRPASDLPVAQSAGELVKSLRHKHNSEGFDLCFTGTRATDPHWNSLLAAHDAVRSLWIPPFAGGGGTAIGAAVLCDGTEPVLRPLHWELRAGCEVARHPHQPEGWTLSPSRPEELARMLHLSDRPVVILTGREKLGPHSLGGRSVLAPATGPAVPERLRGFGAGLTALCLAERAPDVFDPGTPDPYRLFAHTVRPEWTDRLPALRHARLQTVSPDEDPVLTTVLREYYKWSGIPVLCATDLADVPGAHAATRLAGVDAVWSEAVLYRPTTRSR